MMPWSLLRSPLRMLADLVTFRLKQLNV